VAEIKVPSDINARVFKIEVAVGDAVGAGDTLMILESMKMEIPVEAPRAGKVARILVAEEAEIAEGQVLAVLET
jgi:acetyl-CoA carboxylase biotin carboxyl carrier protein